jgi:hypothetical protein
MIIDGEIAHLNKNNEMEINIQTLHIQKKKWRGHNMNVICWASYCVNHDKEVDLANIQVMRCYNNLVYGLNPNNKERKVLITFFKHMV